MCRGLAALITQFSIIHILLFLKKNLCIFCELHLKKTQLFGLQLSTAVIKTHKSPHQKQQYLQVVALGWTLHSEGIWELSLFLSVLFSFQKIPLALCRTSKCFEPLNLIHVSEIQYGTAVASFFHVLIYFHLTIDYFSKPHNLVLVFFLGIFLMHCRSSTAVYTASSSNQKDATPKWQH